MVRIYAFASIQLGYGPLPIMAALRGKKRPSPASGQPVQEKIAAAKSKNRSQIELVSTGPLEFGLGPFCLAGRIGPFFEQASWFLLSIFYCMILQVSTGLISPTVEIEPHAWALTATIQIQKTLLCVSKAPTDHISSEFPFLCGGKTRSYGGRKRKRKKKTQHQ